MRLRSPKSRLLATWLALIGGSLGLHRFYLHGPRDGWGWLCLPPTLLGLYGWQRASQFGLDDHLSWVLLPLLGLALCAGMLAAIVYGLTPDEQWRDRHDPAGPVRHSGWLTVIGVILALGLGAVALMSTVAFSAQRFFEYQAESAAAVAVAVSGTGTG